MKTLIDIFESIETEPNAEVRRYNKSTFYTLINYLEASRKGISEYDMQHFLENNQFSVVFQELVEKSIVEQAENGNYILNAEVKSHISPAFDELTHLAYKSKSKTKRRIKDPMLDILYNCSIEIYGA